MTGKIYLDISLSRSFFSGHFYQLVTYPLMGNGLFEVIFNCLLFWLIGSELEFIWGKKKYIKALVIGVLGGSLTWVPLAIFLPHMGPLAGPGSVINLWVVAFGVLYPDALFSFLFLIPIRARYFAALIIAIELFMGFFSPSGASSFAQLGGVFWGYLFLFFIPSRKKAPKKPKLRLVKEEKDGGKENDFPPKYWH
jgi:membrane associated rhomboid family serine protease